MRSRPLSLILLLLFSLSSGARAVSGGDYGHRYLLPEERSSLINHYGFFSGIWYGEEDREMRGEWKGGVDRRSAAGLWLAGVVGNRLDWFAEGLFFVERGELDAGPARIDLRILGRGIRLRSGRFRFPIGIEPRSAPHRVNRFISRPRLRSEPEAGAGLYGEAGDGAANYSVAWTAVSMDGFLGGLADSILGPPPVTEEGEKLYGNRAVGGRVGLSPGPGLELGLSWAEQSARLYRVTLRGFDFSIRNGPLLLQTEWGRIERCGEGSEEEGNIAYGRLAHRIVEFSEHFEAIDLLLLADYLDRGRGSAGEREIGYGGGLSLSPRPGLAGKIEFRRIDRDGERADRVLAELLVFW